MLNCHKATRLMSESQDRSLNLSEKLSLGFHTILCAGCRNCEKQLKFLRKASQHFVKEQGPGQDASGENTTPDKPEDTSDDSRK